MHAKAYSGMCPWHTESLIEKEIKVSFIGTPPFITRTNNHVDGSDFILTRLFAKKHGFIPVFEPARSVDVVMSNGTTYGMFHRVIRMCRSLVDKKKPLSSLNLTGFNKAM